MAFNEVVSRAKEQMANLGEQEFDYAVLSPRTRSIVQQNAKEIKSLMRRTAQDVINIGQKLIEVKEQLGHGHFETWLRAEFNWGQWTARKFMQVHRQFKSVKFTDLSIDASALYLLAAPSTSDIVRQEALKRAEQGEAITHAKVKAIANSHWESVKSEASKSTIDITAETLKCGASVSAELSAAQNREDKSSQVEEVNFQLSQEEIESSAMPQVNSYFHSTDFSADGDNNVSKEQEEIDIHSPFGVGHSVFITDVGQQNHKWLGEVSEVKRATSTDVEVIIKIALHTSTE